MMYNNNLEILSEYIEVYILGEINENNHLNYTKLYDYFFK